jgi:hypothetical protein
MGRCRLLARSERWRTQLLAHDRDGLSVSRIRASNKHIQPQDAGVLAVLFELCFRPGLDFMFGPGLAFLQVD